MPAPTSTTTTSLPAKKDDSEMRSRAPQEKTPRAPPLEVKEHDFFWTYTEEPHRTRRQAIIKAHPEVPSSMPCLRFNGLTSSEPGHETLRAGTTHEIRRRFCRLDSNPLRISITEYTLPVMEVFPDGIRCGRDGESEFVPGYP